MNLAAFRTRAARVSGMSSSDAGDLALLDAWTNDAVEQFLRETKINVRTASLATTAGQRDYTLDTGILAMQALWFYPTADAQSAVLQPRAPEDIIAMSLAAVTQTTAPRYYALAGANTIMLYPTPLTTGDTLHLLYVPRHTTLSNTADSPSSSAFGNIPAEYHVILEDYVKWKACEAEEHKPSDSGKSFQQAFAQGCTGVRAEMKKKAGVVIPPLRIGRPRTLWPHSPGVDVR